MSGAASDSGSRVAGMAASMDVEGQTNLTQQTAALTMEVELPPGPPPPAAIPDPAVVAQTVDLTFLQELIEQEGMKHVKIVQESQALTPAVVPKEFFHNLISSTC